ncbi:hypothetical protein FHJ31_13190 [Pseudomonas sp. Fig-3]|jgi:vacuolar-type H+-ATPase subunit H|uniref:Lipoprotein n=1 Tax=Pseudomonas rhizophila TaxID=2045200 RepID=A0ABM6UFX3_9PSED|nr:MULTISPECIES: hypothetical protein [Pseudomonas]AVU76408.1 hypothetical protein CRX69_14845 [Pseudomonas rhizophila]MBD0703346.1 hypothetical protein [Pseudomonas sp. PSB1]MDD2032662.1 hypothetical protein [Pseudomonas sp. 39167]MDR8387619.1 hypothetical protein [Pseudomonas sp. JL2]MEA1028307.1 hypothetical protein [Pseudomonas sp. N-137]
MTYKTLGLAALLAVSSIALVGCEQAEKSAQQLMGQAAETAKQAIDDTHKAAEQAISEATGGLISPKKKPADEAEESETSTQTI